MKKVLLTGAALMLAGGMVSTASAAAVEPGVKITGDFRARFGYISDDYFHTGQFGNRDGQWGSQTTFDTRARINFTGTAAGGTYMKARLRLEGGTGDIDNDPTTTGNPTDGRNNLWADLAYIGIPFNDMVTVELGRYRSTYGPLPATNNFFYDDVSSHGVKGIIKIDKIEINPFIEYMEEAQSNTTDYVANQDNQRFDNDEIRYGIHAKGNINKDWIVGGMIGYQMDQRERIINAATNFEPNDGIFGSIYTSGKMGAFGLTSEFAMTESDLNNFNSWEVDQAGVGADLIGSADTGFGGYVFPTYTIDKLTIGINAGFTTGGFQPDRAFGFVMVGTADNSRISAVRIGDSGDWLWAGLVAQYAFSESLKLTGNLVYADVDAWDTKNTATNLNGDGPNTSGGNPTNGAATALTQAAALDNAYEISAVLQYTISKGTDIYFSAGYLKPEFENSLVQEDDGAFGALSRLEVKF